MVFFGQQLSLVERPKGERVCSGARNGVQSMPHSAYTPAKLGLQVHRAHINMYMQVYSREQKCVRKCVCMYV